ncbi:MAG: hypothetical protein Q9221_006398 [Calogaya cf. arnoldii]
MDNSPNPQIMGLVEDIGRVGHSYGQQEPGARERLLSLAYKLAAAVELPSETIQRMGWAEVRDAMPSHDVAGPSFHHLPAYLKSISYEHPTDIADGPFQYAHNTASPFFVWLQENPELASCFNSYMGGYRAGKAFWVDPGFYPLDERLCKGVKAGAEEVLLVDVGGGMGHDLELLKEKQAHVGGRLILQDTAQVIGQITAPDTAFERMTHDFFTTQPVQGARAYYLHSVLHDWDNASCIAILKNLVSAMENGYSKILINELVVPDCGASWSVTSMDWLMLALGAIKERTEEDWYTLIGQAGLKVTGVWTKEQVFVSRAQNPYDPKANDVIVHGQYLIKRCGKGIPGGKADQLSSLLEDIAEDLPSIIIEAADGINSTHGFQNLFTSNDAASYVAEYFTRISSNAPVVINGKPQKIEFICLEKEDPFYAIYYRRMALSRIDIFGFSEEGTEKIFLPPYFFKIATDPAFYSCPFTGHRSGDKNVYGGEKLGFTQWGVIIHELMDKYLDHDGRRDDFNETYAINKIVRLPPEQQRLNAENYAVFASAIKAECEMWPN